MTKERDYDDWVGQFYVSIETNVGPFKTRREAREWATAMGVVDSGKEDYPRLCMFLTSQLGFEFSPEDAANLLNLPRTEK